MPSKRITMIPGIHGKLTRDRKMSEPDIYWILEKWLERHPEIKGRERDIQISRGRWTFPEGIRTLVIDASIITGHDIAGYDQAQDVDLYAYFLAEEQDEGNCR